MLGSEEPASIPERISLEEVDTLRARGAQVLVMDARSPRTFEEIGIPTLSPSGSIPTVPSRRRSGWTPQGGLARRLLCLKERGHGAPGWRSISGGPAGAGRGADRRLGRVVAPHPGAGCSPQPMARSWNRWPWIALAGVVALVCVGYLEIFSPDVGNHLASGRWILAHGWPDHDPLTWTRTDTPYVDLLWGWHVLLWVLYRWGGTLPLVLTGIVLPLATCALLVHRGARMRASGPVRPRAASSSAWETFGSCGRTLASWLLLNLVLLSLESGVVWPLPLLLLVWVMPPCSSWGRSSSVPTPPRSRCKEGRPTGGCSCGQGSRRLPVSSIPGGSTGSCSRWSSSPSCRDRARSRQR